MKRKYLILIMTLTISITIFGCTNNDLTNEVKVLDTIAIDENTSETVSENSEFKVIMTSKTEKVDYINDSSQDIYDGNITYYTYSLENKEDSIQQFPKIKLDSLKIGKISDEKDVKTGLNKISWQKKNEDGRILTDYISGGVPRILKDGKVYKFNNSGELEEITAYKPLVKKLGQDINRFQSYLNGRIDLYWIGRMKSRAMRIVDTEENKYYEVDGKALEELNNRSISILGIENNKIYVSLTDTEADYNSTIGYFEDNKYTKLISSDNGISMDIKGDIIYANGKILFSGYVEDKNGIWNYDIESNKIVREMDVEDETFFELHLNKEKNKIALSGHDYNNGSNKYTLNIGLIDENLEISNLSNVFLVENNSSNTRFKRWDKDGKSFYLSSLIQNNEEEISDDTNFSYEVYEINN